MSPTRLKHIAVLSTEATDHGPRPLVALENLGSGTGRLLPETQLVEVQTPSAGVADVAVGDVLFGKLRPYLAKSWVADRPSFASAELLCLRPQPTIDSRWLGYVVASWPFVEWAVATSDGTKMPRTSWEKLGEFRLSIPRLGTQRAIADHLDRETLRIDSIIAARRQMVKLLEEHQASWLHDVLDGFREAVGSIRLKSVAGWVEGPGIMRADFRDEGVPLLRIRNLVGDTVDLTDCGFVSPSLAGKRWNHLRVRAGELLISGSARSGSPVIVPPEAAGAVPYTGLIRIWPTSPRLDREFLRLFLVSPMFAMQIDRLKTGVGLQHWGPYHLAQISMPLPAMDEQLAVAGEFAFRDRRLRKLAQLQLKEIDLLLERRRALVSGAISGQLGIREAE